MTTIAVGCLALAAPTQAAITATQVTSPTDPSFYNPVTNPDDGATVTINGTTDSTNTASDKVDVRCVLAANGSQVNVMLNDPPGVSLDGSGNFSFNAVLNDFNYFACRLIAVPAGVAGPYNVNNFQGPRVGVGGVALPTVSGGPNAGALYDYYQGTAPFGGYADPGSAGSCFLGSTFLIDPVSPVLNYVDYGVNSPFFGCQSIRHAPNPPGGQTTYGGLTIDGNKSYLPSVARSLPLGPGPNADQRAGFQGIQGYARNFNFSNGTATVDGSEPAVHCGGFPASDANCASFSSSNVRLDQHASVEQNGRSIVYDHNWANTGSGTRQVDVYYEAQLNATGFKFPGEGSFAGRVAGDATGSAIPVPPAGPGTVRVLGTAGGTPCAFTAADQCGSLTWSTRPNDVVFTDTNKFWLHYVFAVPEGCTVPIHLGYTQSDSLIVEGSLIADLESRFAGSAMTCTAPGGGGGGASNPPAGNNPPSNAFILAARKPKAGAKSISFSVELPGGGDLGAALSTTSKLSKTSNLGKTNLRIPAAGKRNVTVKLNKKARNALRKKRRLKSTLKVTFKPTGGTAASKTAKLTLRGKRK